MRQHKAENASEPFLVVLKLAAPFNLPWKSFNTALTSGILSADRSYLCYNILHNFKGLATQFRIQFFSTIEAKIFADSWPAVLVTRVSYQTDV
jgi:hypothetical protein